MGVSGAGRLAESTMVQDRVSRARPLRILQVNTADTGGGAEGSARNLYRAFAKLGHESWLAVGSKRSRDSGVLPIAHEPYRSTWARLVNRAAVHAWRIAGRHDRSMSLLTGIRSLGEPARTLRRWLGHEDFSFPGTARLLELTPEPPDIVHCHNLHGGYFDLGAIPSLAANVPLILNLHDSWLLSGHCACPMACGRWRLGCGQCPDLTLYPAVQRDATRYNWRRKRRMYSRARLFVTTPSAWMMNRVGESMLASQIIDSRVIPNGVDTELFQPGDKLAARRRCGLSTDRPVLLCVGNGLSEIPWKGFDTLARAIEIWEASPRFPPCELVLLGERVVAPRSGRVRIVPVRPQRDPRAVARYYHAADLCVHVALEEVFGNVLLEARACRVPVVATSVGGVAEQVNGLQLGERVPGTHSGDSATGVLVKPGDATQLAHAVALLLEDDAVRERLADNGLDAVRSRFSVEVQAGSFLRWYDEILEGRFAG